MSSSELESRSTAISMQKSVENLVISSQDAIGQSISQALTFSGVLTKHASQAMQEYKSVSRSPSPSLRQADVINDLEYDKPNEISACKPAADNISVSSASDVASPSPAPLRDSKSSSGQRGSDAQTRTKKKSWYNSLYPTYKSKSEDFKRIFKDLPVDERLIVDYSCALQKDILAQGRLYASQNYMCFYANILGWETNVTVRWKDVTAITKEKTALVIPNAILVCTDSEKHFLASITGRDKAYLMLFRIWQNALMDQPVSSQEIWHWVHTCYGEELGFNSDDEDNRQYCRDFADDAAHALEAADEAELAESSLELAYSESKRTRSTSRGRDASPARGSAGDGCPREGDVLPTDMSGSSDSEPDKPPGGDVEKCSSAHEGRLLLQQEFPFNIDQLFTMIFTNSKFNLELLAARKASDYVQANWQSSGGRQVRRVSYTAALAAGPLGPKEVHVTETQIMNKCSKPGVQYSIDASSENAGIPYADYFSVEVHYCMQRVTEHSTSLSMFGYIRYKKSMWPVVKAFLEKNAISGVEEFCRLLEERLRGESEGQAQTGRKVHRQRRHNVAPQLARSAPPGLAPPAPRSRPPLLLALLAGALLLANAALYWRLWRAEPPHTELYERMKLVSASQQAEWARLAAAGAARQRDQRRAWDRAVQAALLQLRQTEETLAKLLEAIKPSLDPGPKREPPPPPPSPAQPVRTDL